MIVTPWEVKGEIDYNQLIEEFGTERINESLLKRIKKHTGELHFLLRRKIFFSHRDMNWLLDEYEAGNKFYLYTGRGPSGEVHLGHLMPWIFTKWLQDKFNVKLIFQMTDDEKFLFKEDKTLKETNSLAYENALDLIALGFKPGNTEIIIDTEHIKQLYPTALEVSKKITFSTAKAVFGFTNANNLGQIFFTAIQSVPAFIESIRAGRNIPCLIPYAIDQDPHFRVTRDVAPKLGYYKPAAIHCRFMPGLKEGGKMSSSEHDSVIYTTDTPEDVERKIGRAFSGGKETIEKHRREGGNPEVDMSFQLLKNFFEPDDKKLMDIYHAYKDGTMLSGELKQITADRINKFLKEHQKKRELAKKTLKKYMAKD